MSPLSKFFFYTGRSSGWRTFTCCTFWSGQKGSNREAGEMMITSDNGDSILNYFTSSKPNCMYNMSFVIK